MLAIGLFMTIGGAYTSIKSIADQYAAGTVSSAFSCADKWVVMSFGAFSSLQLYVARRKICTLLEATSKYLDFWYGPSSFSF